MFVGNVIEILALIVAIISLFKIITLLIKPKVWLSFAEKIYAKPLITIIISLILSMIVLFYLLKELTIVQIFSVIAFVFLIMTLCFACYAKETKDFAKKIINKEVIKKGWIALIIWFILLIWMLYFMFA